METEPGAPLNAPARRAAARLSDGFTVAPANTASSEAAGAEVVRGGGAGAGEAAAVGPLCGCCGGLPDADPADRGGFRLPRVAKNSLIDGSRAAMPSGSARGSSLLGASTDSRWREGAEGESMGVRSKLGVSSESGAPGDVGDSIEGERGAAGGAEGRSMDGGSRRDCGANCGGAGGAACGLCGAAGGAACRAPAAAAAAAALAAAAAAASGCAARSAASISAIRSLSA